MPLSTLDLDSPLACEALHVTERHQLIDYGAAIEGENRNIRRNGSSGNFQAAGIDAGYRGKGLQVEFTVDDPNVFRMPWSGAATYRKSDGTWVENVCAENLHEYYSNRDTQAPQAGKPDFLMGRRARLSERNSSTRANPMSVYGGWCGKTARR